MRQIGNTQARDTLDELLDPKACALLVIDLQNDFCNPEGLFAQGGKDVSAMAAIVPAAVDFIARAQALGVRIFFVRQTTLPDGRSDSAAWLRFKSRDGKSPAYTLKGSWGWQLVDGVRPSANDWEIDKYRPDAFVYTPLDQMLRVNGVESVMVMGTTTEGCVESTVRGASYHDYYTLVVEDLVAGPHRVQHENAMALFRSRYTLVTAETALTTWERARSGEPSALQ